MTKPVWRLRVKDADGSVRYVPVTWSDMGANTVYAVPTLAGGTTTTASANTLHYCMIKGSMCVLATQEGYCKITACAWEGQG